MMNPRVKELFNRWRVRVGWIAAIAVIILARPTWLALAEGIFVSVIGLAIRAWASGHLQKEKELTVSGPYRFSRNPLYLGSLIIGVGIVVGARSWWALGLFVVYFGAFYPLIIRRERDRMKQLFPEQYEEYKKTVPSFFPSLKKRSIPSGTRFSWSLYKQNKEYRALVGGLVFWLILTAKIFLLNR